MRGRGLLILIGVLALVVAVPGVAAAKAGESDHFSIEPGQSMDFVCGSSRFTSPGTRSRFER